MIIMLITPLSVILLLFQPNPKSATRLFISPLCNCGKGNDFSFVSHDNIQATFKMHRLRVEAFCLDARCNQHREPPPATPRIPGRKIFSKREREREREKGASFCDCWQRFYVE